MEEAKTAKNRGEEWLNEEEMDGCALSEVARAGRSREKASQYCEHKIKIEKKVEHTGHWSRVNYRAYIQAECTICLNVFIRG